MYRSVIMPSKRVADPLFVHIGTVDDAQEIRGEREAVALLFQAHTDRTDFAGPIVGRKLLGHMICQCPPVPYPNRGEKQYASANGLRGKALGAWEKNSTNSRSFTLGLPLAAASPDAP